MRLTPSSPTPAFPAPAPPTPAPPAPPAHDLSAAPLGHPLPLGTDAPATCEVPHFAPVRVRGGRYRLQRLVRHRRRALAAGLAVTAAALVAAGPGAGTEPHRTERPRGHPAAHPADRSVRRHGPADVVRAPVRIADPDAVRLLRPGDRVDVIAAEDPSTGGGVRVLARGARVASAPESLTAGTADGTPDAVADHATDGAGVSGALVVLSVPRATAARLVGASPTARLAVTLW